MHKLNGITFTFAVALASVLTVDVIAKLNTPEQLSLALDFAYSGAVTVAVGVWNRLYGTVQR